MKFQPLLTSGILAWLGLLALISFVNLQRSEFFARCLPTSPQDGSTSSQEPAPSPKIAEAAIG